MIRDLDRVVLKVDLPAEKLKAGDVGTVVHVYPKGVAFEVEFVTLNGDTLAVVTVEARQVRAARAREVPHARVLTSR